MLPNNIYCDLKPTGSFFSKKALYKCDTCGLTVALEDPNVKMTCFKKTENIYNVIHAINNGTSSNIEHYAGNINDIKDSTLKDNLLNKLQIESKKIEEDRKIQQDKQYQQEQENHNREENLCSSSEIESRLKICNGCEYFMNNSCLLCGCTIVREANHKNKLAHRNQTCPANKWGPILPQNG